MKLRRNRNYIEIMSVMLTSLKQLDVVKWTLKGVLGTAFSVPRTRDPTFTQEQ